MSTQQEPDTTPQRSDFMRANKVSSTRALTLYSVGVIVGLILGGIGLFNARGTTTNKVPPEDLALVNQRPILRSDFITQLEGTTGMPFAETTKEEQLSVLDEMIREELFVQRGLELDFAETDQNTRLALYDVVEQQVQAEVTVSGATEEKLRKYFEAHSDKFMSDGQLNVHDLVQPDNDAEKANAAATALRQGTDLEKVKQQYGLVEEEYYDNDPYYSAKTHLGDALYASVITMESATVSNPISADDGLHVVQVISNEKPAPLNYEEAINHGLSFEYYSAEKERVISNMLKFLRGRSTILIADEYKNDYNPDAVNGSK